MQKHFQAALGADVKVYSQADLVAESLANYLERHPKMLGEGTETMFLTTGDPACCIRQGHPVPATKDHLCRCVIAEPLKHPYIQI